MIRIIFIALWSTIAGLSASTGTVYWSLRHDNASHSAEAPHGLEHKKTRIINVPMIADGQVQGYIVAQFVYIAGSADLKALSTPPEAFIIDEAFRQIYTDQKLDFRKLDKPDLVKMTEQIRAGVARRLKSDVIKEILVQDFNYVSKDDIRK